MFRIKEESNTHDQGEIVGIERIMNEGGNTRVIGRREKEGRKGKRGREEKVKKKKCIEFKRRVTRWNKERVVVE